MNYKAIEKWEVGSIPVANVSISDVRKRNLKTSAIEIIVDKTKLPREEIKGTISTFDDPQSVADIKEVVVTLTGQKGWCGECAILKIELDDLKGGCETLKIEDVDMTRGKGLIRARDTISEVVAVVYNNIEFEHDGHFVSKYGEVYALRKVLRSLKEDVSGLNKAVFTSVAKSLKKGPPVAGPTFDIICEFKSGRNRLYLFFSCQECY